MNAPTYETVPVTCPSCQNRFVAPVVSVIDVGQNREAKTLFLSGQINIAACPQCGNSGMLSTPLVYHDPDKELLFTYMPTGAVATEADQQRIIGDLTNRVISALPVDQRKGYLLQPRAFLRLEGMIEAVLEADGVTPEMLAAQRAKGELLERLLLASTEEARRAIVHENDSLIDYEFFQYLTLNIELARAGEDTEQTDIALQLEALRGQLLDWTTKGRDLAAAEDAIRSLGPEVAREDLLDKLVGAALSQEQVKIEAMVSYARPAIDYLFYQQLTGRIEAAEAAGNAEEAQILKDLRESVLDLTAQIDAEVEQATERAGRLLQQLLASEDPEAEIRANAAQIDELFLGVLAAAQRSAERSGNSETAEKLNSINATVFEVMQESQPPDIRLINRLMLAQYPDETKSLLEEHREYIDASLLEAMSLIRDDLVEHGRAELADRLVLVQDQARAMVD